jgi:hypothetical protein
MSADPYIQSADSLQSYNRYSYLSNDPLDGIDPSGYFSLKQFLRMSVSIAIAAAMGPAVIPGNAFLGSLQVFDAGMLGGSATAAAIANGAAAGFVSSAISSGTLKGAVQGAFSGALFASIGAYGKIGDWSDATLVAAHAGAGCLSAVAGGGRCGAGALPAGLSKLATVAGPEWLKHPGPDGLKIAGGVAFSAVVGGTASRLGGGKFANGAQTAAFGYLFNELLNEGGRVAALTRSGYTLLPVNLPGVGETYLDPRMASAVGDWIDLAKGKGVDIHFNSAFRTVGAPVDGAVFTPVGDTSLHNAGLAVDVRYDKLANIEGGLSGDEQRKVLRETATSAGLRWGGRSETVSTSSLIHMGGPLLGDRA